MPKSQKRRSDSERTQNKRNVARNKIRRIERELKHAGGNAVAQLESRLAFWRGK